MGTNYYLKTEECSHCGRSDEMMHIGKSSAGWCFSLHVYPDEDEYEERQIIHDLEDWKPLFELKENTIVDEYGDVINTKKMLDIITNRRRDIKPGSHPMGYGSWEQFHLQNNSCNGPNNLLRCKLDNSHCVKHGEGTWDCIIGYFS